jgi:hypothetical protein
MTLLRRWAVPFALTAALASGAGAQEMGNGFMFGNPRGTFALRGGWAAASATSELFAFTTNELTLDRRDFSSPSVGLDLGIRVLERTHLIASIDLSGVDKHSEFRNYIDNNDLPIEQSTRFRRVPVTLSVKQYLTTQGRSIGKFAWIPARFAAYVGAGGGTEWYQFTQQGDFIDFSTLEVFGDTYASDGWAAEGHAFVGVDYSVATSIALSTEARYSRSTAPLSRDFIGFDRLDLSGFSTTLGLTFRF